MDMDRKKEIIIVVVAVLVVAGIAAMFLVGGGSKSGLTGQGQPAGGGPLGATETGAPVTRTEVPDNVTVPAEKASSTPADVAVPTLVSPGDPTNSTSYRVFSIKASDGAFSPSQIIVYVGDTVQLTIAAIDQAYDFTLPDYGMKVAVAKGASQELHLTPSSPGKFLFYCTSCGGPSEGPTGYLVVAPKQ